MRAQPIFPLIVTLLAAPGLAAAQDLPRRVFEVSGGFAGFVDESIIPHGSIGAAVRWDLARHLSIGPEFIYMRESSRDQDLFLTVKVVSDFRRTRAIAPYVVADGGLLINRSTFLHASPFWWKGGAVSGGGGVRIKVTRRVFVAPEMRIGWEPHIRFTAIVGWRM